MVVVFILQVDFVRIELRATQILRGYKNLSNIHWATRYRVTQVTLNMSSPRRVGVLRSPKLDKS